MNIDKLKHELTNVINCNCIENQSGTPDFLLAQYLLDCLDSYAKVVKARDKWYGHKAMTCDNNKGIAVEPNPSTL